MIRLMDVVVDCPDPAALARFYADLIGATATVDPSGDWATVEHPGVNVAFQGIENYRAPDWPSQEHGQQFHFDFDVDDFESDGARAVELGATFVESHIREDGTGFVVYLDPAGHPFCLCK